MELFPKTKDLNSLHDLSLSKSKYLGSAGSMDNRSKEDLKQRRTGVSAHNKTYSTDSAGGGFERSAKLNGALIGYKPSIKTNTNSDSKD